MTHIPVLMKDLSLILATAGMVTLVFRKLRQPVVLGYILAGILVGPHISFFMTVSDLSTIRIWAEIGVVFLLFGLGLDFSFKKLIRIGHSASVIALVEVTAMLVIGYVTGTLLGWSKMDSLFLGGILCISSTTIIVRAFEELGIKEQKFAGLVFGVLIVEDLVAVLLLVLLSTVAMTQRFAGEELVSSVFRLGFFILLWFMAGILLIPLLLRKLKKLLSDEALTILSLGLCFGMVMVASRVGFSPALGAFVMGSILAETPEGERIHDLTLPIRNLFAAIFFVSVGMLIEPQILLTYAVPVLIISAVTMVGKVLSTTTGALVSGQNLRSSVQTGFSLAQIGEFSFIIAALGLELGVTSEFLYPIAVAVSTSTTFATPYLIRVSDPVYSKINAHLPAKWQEKLKTYGARLQMFSAENELKVLVKVYGAQIVLNAVVILAVFLLSFNILGPLLPKIFTLICGFLVAAPFLWALALGRTKMGSVREVWEKKNLRPILLFFEVVRKVIALTLIGFFLSRFVSTGYVALGWLVGICLLILFLNKRLQFIYGGLERQFLWNLDEKDRLRRKPALAPWDAHLVVLRVAPESPCVGQTLSELGIRERFGVTLALIERGGLRITAPDRNDRLFPYDELTVIGTDEELAKFRYLVEDRALVGNATETEPEYVLRPVVLDESSPFSFKTIRESGIREMTRGLVVGVERAGKRLLNPDSTFRLEPNDTVWLVGNFQALESDGQMSKS